MFGPLFGVGVYMVMNYLVVPLSASPLKPPAGDMVVKGLLVHMLVFGLPIALIVSRSMRAVSPSPLHHRPFGRWSPPPSSTGQGRIDPARS